MNRSNPTNPYRTLGWTFLLLTLAVILFSEILVKSGAVLSEEMQVRDAEQQAGVLR